MTTLYIDADACPVKDEALEIAARHETACVLVSNGGMRPSRYPGARIVTVSDGADAADDWIVEALEAGDVVVTADIPLAARALEKDALVLNSDGRDFTPASIGTALSMRAFKQHLRETGESKGYNRSYTPADRSRFRQRLDIALRKASRPADEQASSTKP
ncbi:YaiI/YqxD family protein [Aureimonas sp. Leaf454]|uniref:YaiI/YqxD family protein n=1 Tax=Aureimonas sp. Leaf454 TaxID=1736381 RepID=UPI000A3DBCC1|nr:YaiI/YqxD family protein [Aureimonas sp. Leaf454]